MKVKFDLGQVVITTNAHNKLNQVDVQFALYRHAKGDWGNMPEEDKQTNEEALQLGNRLMSEYLDRAKTKFWIITEADRSATTILLPEDY